MEKANDNAQQSLDIIGAAMSYTTILAEAYNYSEYAVKNLYYKGQGYTSNNQLKKNLIAVAHEKNDPYSFNIEKMLQLTIRNPINEIFLKPFYSTHYPSNITQLIQMVNNDGYYLLFSETSHNIFEISNDF